MDNSDFGAGRLVLVVDDHADFRVATQDLLASMGFRVACAANGVEALKLLEYDPVFLIVTDLFMPKMDGLELMTRLRKGAKPAPPIIAVTGDAHVASDAVGKTAAALGARAVLFKPFTRDQLAAAIAVAGQRDWDTRPSGQRVVRTEERRVSWRSSREERATTLIQGMLDDPSKVAQGLEAELRGGADVAVAFALLPVAQSLAALRGVDLSREIASVRAHLKEARFQP